VAERSNAAVSKTVSGFRVRRGFKSPLLRCDAPEAPAPPARLACAGASRVDHHSGNPPPCAVIGVGVPAG
jgi:hypothetical protein